MADTMTLKYIPLEEIRRVRASIANPIQLCSVLANIFRVNALYMIMRAGSGHIGTSFSCMDILTWLWTHEMKNPNEKYMEESDLFFSSKGHDAPALYAVLTGLEKMDFNLIHSLRKLDGLPGHPDVQTTPQVITNTGSLGMGISKARGFSIARRAQEKHRRIYVLTGDGELQEGQIWESLQPVANEALNEITVIVDHNKIQSDTFVHAVSDLGMLVEKFSAFGWEVGECDGHELSQVSAALSYFKTVETAPQVLIAHTIKGKGVSFMERIDPNDGMYHFHSGAPSVTHYEHALEELTGQVNNFLNFLKIDSVQLESVEIPARVGVASDVDRLVSAHGEELLRIAREQKNVIAMDADLVLDTGLVYLKQELPTQYIECGIAEQDMVSMAGGLALSGFIPVVHSFACFLSTRPNEQIYNNASERTKIVYVGSLAGITPATPGHSHQSVRDISCIGSIPGISMIEPSDEMEARMAIRWAIEENKRSTYIRLVSVPITTLFSLPDGYRLEKGRGVFLKQKPYDSAVIIAYGPVMLNEAMRASEILAQEEIFVSVMNLPWLNEIDLEWLQKTFCRHYNLNRRLVVTLDDHYVSLGQGMQIASSIAASSAECRPRVVSLGMTDFPACGQNAEVIARHGLNAFAIAERVRHLLKYS